MDELQSRTIDFLRFPLIVLVIYIHSFGAPLSDNPSVGVAIYDEIRIFFSHIISRVSVPAFYLMSGYLFFYKASNYDKTFFRKKLITRSKTVLIPYLAWNLLYIFYLMLVMVAKGFVDPIWNTGKEILDFFNNNGWLNCLWANNVWPYRLSWFGWECFSYGPVLEPLWFLRDLFVAFVLSCFIYWTIRVLKQYMLFILLFCFVSGFWPNIPGLSIDCIFFYSLGAYFSINKRNMIKEFSRYEGVVLPIFVILLVLMIYYKSDFTTVGNYFYPFFLISPAELTAQPGCFIFLYSLIIESAYFFNSYRVIQCLTPVSGTTWACIN